MTNPDVAQAPAPWRSVAADARMEFFLAKTSPDGGVSSGITLNPDKTTAFSLDGNPVKAAATGGTDPWPASTYLNISVCQLSSGLLGYAEFPALPR